MEKEIKERIIKKYNEGMNAVQLSKIFPYHHSTISRMLRQEGVSRGRKSKKRLEISEQVVNDFCKENLYCEDLAKKYKVDVHTIYRILDEANIKRKSGYHTKCNEHYFQTIDTPHKAYLLGFITADGAIVNNVLAIEIHRKDRELLDFAKAQINPEAKIITINYNGKDNVRVSFCTKQIGIDLAKYGVIQNKSKLIKKVPIELIPSNLLPFYFRGLIDGDGCIHKNGRVSIYSGSYDFISNVQQILCQLLDLKHLEIYKGSAYFISWSSKEDREKLYHFLYDNLEDTFYYQRKYTRLKDSLYANTEVTN